MLEQDRTSQTLAVGMSCLAGFVDALGFLGLGGVFISFMSGNSTRLAVGISDPALFSAILPLSIIVLFVGGVMLGKIVRHHRPVCPSTAVLVFMLGIMICGGVSYELQHNALAIAILAIAMGAANNVFVKEKEVSIGVTYMTGTLVKFGQRLVEKFLGEKDSTCLPYFFLWLGLVLGAILGAIGYSYVGLRALWVGTVFCGFLAWNFYLMESRGRSV